MIRYALILLLFIVLFGTNNGYGQTSQILTGTVVLEQPATPAVSKSSAVRITNLNKQHSTHADNLGNFSINGHIGDSLEFYSKGLPKRLIVIKSYAHLTVYLDSTILLDEVAIAAQRNKKTDLKATAAAYSKHNSIYFNGRPPITLLSPFDGSPITFFRELLSKDGKKVRRFNRFVDQQLELDEVEARFNTTVIKQVIPSISDEEIEKFKTAYTPTLTELRKWSTYELYDYIKTSYKQFRKADNGE
ncbi:hypothetical protein GCM10023231_31490 [Olivibacter ginsenosidimutans]|uniref:Carboxypeptidase-like regulatory domain-containing protein n=1 Tax=Olivibacter ginsenosidimutans TaxID=1176537 RepID=A0ABP9BYB6_9SPHI